MEDGRTGQELLRESLAGDASATRNLIAVLTPVVQVRVARALLRSAVGRRQGRDLRQEVEDFVQEILSALFASAARTLRAWDPSRGLSLVNYVGLVAEHQVASILRSGRRSPWKEEATSVEALDHKAGATEGIDGRVQSRDVLARLLPRLQAELSPLGLQMFQWLVVEERTVEGICEETGMKPDAVYAWRSRLAKHARKLHDELAGDV